METTLYASLLLWTALWVCDEHRQRRAWIPAALLLFGRPEAPVFAFALLLCLALLRVRRADVAKQVGLLLAIAMVAEVARFLYFHDLVSQAFYLKIGGGGRSRPGGSSGTSSAVAT